MCTASICTDYRLTVFLDNTVVSYFKLKALERDTVSIHVYELWKWCLSNKPPLKSSIDFTQFVVTYNQEELKLSDYSPDAIIGAFFGHEEDPSKLLSLVTTMECKHKVYTKRVGKHHLPASAWIQTGTISDCSKINWGPPSNSKLSWSATCNTRDEPGITTGEHGYAGWIPTVAVYAEYNSTLADNTNCMRILEVEGYPILRIDQIDEGRGLAESKCEKLISPDGCEGNSHTMVKPSEESEMISIDAVATMLLNLAVGFARHFELDVEKVSAYLDGVCKDTTGHSPHLVSIVTDTIDEAKGSTTSSEADDVQTTGSPAASEADDEAKGSTTSSEADDVQATGSPAASEADDLDKTEVKKTISPAEFTEWTSPTGGLKLTVLKQKAQEYGISTVGKKRAEIVESLKKIVADTEKELCIDQINIWFLAPAKGGLKLAELRAKAKEHGIDAGTMKREKIKEAMLGLCADAEKSDAEETKFKDAYLEAPGAKGKKFWKCTVNGTEMTTVYGSVGTTGTSLVKNFDSVEDAVTAATKQLNAKFKNGYSEVCPPKKKAVAVKSATTGQCMYIFPRSQTSCKIKPKGGEKYCAKHTSSQQAINHTANNTTAAKKSSKKMSADSISVAYNDKLKAFQVEGHNLLVKSPNNKVVYAFENPKGKINKKLTAVVKKLAAELGLDIEDAK